MSHLKLMLFMARDEALEEALERINAADWTAQAELFEQRKIEARSSGRFISNVSYEQNGTVGIVSASGAMTKEANCMSSLLDGGGFSTVEAEKAILQATADPDTKSTLFKLDSPGGDVRGTSSLADTIARANKIKPIWVYADDEMCSAALYAGSQGEQVFANDTANVGSIGVITGVVDTSEAAAESKVKYKIVRTGAFKGIGVGNSPVTDEQMAHIEERANAIFGQFKQAVASGRHMDMSAVDKIADGRVFVGAQAKKVGLVDGIAPLSSVLARMQGKDAKELRKPKHTHRSGRMAADERTAKMQDDVQAAEAAETASESMMDRLMSRMAATFGLKPVAQARADEEAAKLNGEIAKMAEQISSLSADVAKLRPLAEAGEQAFAAKLAEYATEYNRVFGVGKMDADKAKAEMAGKSYAQLSEKVAELAAKASADLAPDPANPQANGRQTEIPDPVGDAGAAARVDPKDSAAHMEHVKSLAASILAGRGIHSAMTK